MYRLGIVPKQEDAKALMQEKGYKSGILKIAHLVRGSPRSREVPV